MPTSIKELTEVNHSALEFFRHSFKQSPEAKKYVYSRISRTTATAFKIGYAPHKGLIGWLTDTNPELVKVARELSLVNVVGHKIQQKFYNRIMIPIFHAGIVVGFGGRALDDDAVKYINSNNSLLYHKREVLYGLHQNRLHIINSEVAYLVEGYFDVLGMAEHKMRNAVASCGTALTRAQAQLLKRYAKKVFVLFDGDEAGQKAAVKAKAVLQDVKIYAGRIILPEGYDPDTFLKKYGKKDLHNLKVKY